MTEFLSKLKTTTVVNGRLALRTERLRNARERRLAYQVMTVEHLASRLAGGFCQIVDIPTLRGLVNGIIESADIGELNPMRSRPGMPNACANTLMKFWLSGIDRETHAGHPRMKAILALEDAVMEAMPANLLRPADVAAAALARIRHAPMIFGSVVFKGMTDLHPVWRPLFDALAATTDVTWEAGPRDVPGFVEASGNVAVLKSGYEVPEYQSASCATERHEAVEAVRWARELVVSGVRPCDVAIATVSMRTYAELMAAVVESGDVPVHMTSGVPAVVGRDGQTAAALADLLLRGISQKRVSRLFSLIGPGNGALQGLPADWELAVPPDAALTTVARWKKVLLRKPSTQPVADVVLPLLELVSKGTRVAAEIGRRFLDGHALALWERALLDGPAAALDRTIKDLKVDDGVDPLTSVCFTTAECLAASPRPYVRLIGLTSRSWPRHQSEDALIPRHVVPTSLLDPMSVSRLDEVDYKTIVDTTARIIVMSWPRRDSQGRELGISGLVPSTLRERATRLSSTRRAEAPLSETDRLFSRISEFRLTAQARAAAATVADWTASELTAHDGLVQAGHPRIVRVLEQAQSATSLRKLLRDPLSFVWVYALGFRAPEYEDEPLLLDARQFGNIVHEILRRTVEVLSREGGFAKVSRRRLESAVESARLDVGGIVETSQPVPPTLVWLQTMDLAEQFAKAALSQQLPLETHGFVSHAEVPFGRSEKWPRADRPWDQDSVVTIPGTSVRVQGVIDRLDVTADGRMAVVVDYKSGKTPPGVEDFVLNGGKELQRPLYSYAVKSLLGDGVSVQAALSYPHSGTFAPLPDPEAALSTLAGFVATAVGSILDGAAVAGEDAEDRFSDTKFALPAQADAIYLARKAEARNKALTDLSHLWSHP